ncbi:MAG: sulfatase [Bryobacter sp.]|jgi:arylsulfatase A-like enzyme|nr:sulfatase [Bryobacter sp. CoA8 C33]
MRRRDLLSTLLAPSLLASPRVRNVLLIAIDDMRPELGCYGARHVHSPNIDALARRGTVFTHAYCQQAVCSPSRTSLLTGLRPDTTKIYDLQHHFRGTVPDAVTLPQLFKQNGFTTAGFGKLFHGGLDDNPSWSIPWWGPNQQAAWNSPEARTRAQRLEQRLKENNWTIPPTSSPAGSRGPSWEASSQSDDQLPDGRTLNQAIAALPTLKQNPFFLGVGFAKPHLPFIAPSQYFDLYPLNKIEMPDYPEPPSGAPPFAGTNSGELRYYGDIGNGKISSEKARELVRAYYACISYTDALIGRLLTALDREGLRDSTMVVLFGDHGWQLNNHGLWNKHTNYEKATRSLLIASLPGQRSPGKPCHSLVEFIDIYPSMASAAGLTPPAACQGASFLPQLDNPKSPGKPAAFSQYPRTHEGQRLMGYSLRDARFRYTEWRKRGSTDVVARELYDYQSDPNESRNHAADPAHLDRIKKMSAAISQIAAL